MGIYKMDREWIDVKERLPEPGQIVDLAIRATNGNYGDGSWHIGSGHRYEKCPSSWCTHYGSIAIEHDYPLPMPSVTHWMPLPPPPSI